MTIPSQFASWLAVAERDGQGGLSAEPAAIIRGQTRSFTIHLPAHEIYGDYTDGVFAAPLRASPGASGAALAEYVCTIGAPVASLTPITLVLLGSAQTLLPVSDISTGLCEVFLSLDYTPPAGSKDSLISTRQLVRSSI